MAGAGKGSKSGDVKESTDSSTTIEEDEKGKQIKICKVIDDYFLVNPGMDNIKAGLLWEPVLGRRRGFPGGAKPIIVLKIPHWDLKRGPLESKASVPTIELSWLLCISTSKQVLRMLFTGWSHLFLLIRNTLLLWFFSD